MFRIVTFCSMPLILRHLESSQRGELPGARRALAFDILSDLICPSPCASGRNAVGCRADSPYSGCSPRLLRGLLEDRIDIAESGIVRAAHDALDSCGRAFPLVARDVDPSAFEITLSRRRSPKRGMPWNLNRW